MIQTMDRVNKIIKNSDYQKYLNELRKNEKNRKFCRHNLSHFLDVARIASIINLKTNAQIDDEHIYAAALLHDIGRAKAETCGASHAVTSAKLSEKILRDCCFSELEINYILDAIIKHSDKNLNNVKNLSGILYIADKLSRPCYVCDVKESCFWNLEKKNLKLKI